MIIIRKVDMFIPDADLTLATRVVSATSRFSTAAAISVNVRPIVCSSIEVMLRLRVRVRAASSGVQFG